MSPKCKALDGLAKCQVVTQSLTQYCVRISSPRQPAASLKPTGLLNSLKPGLVSQDST